MSATYHVHMFSLFVLKAAYTYGCASITMWFAIWFAIVVLAVAFVVMVCWVGFELTDVETRVARVEARLFYMQQETLADLETRVARVETRIEWMRNELKDWRDWWDDVDADH